MTTDVRDDGRAVLVPAEVRHVDSIARVWHDAWYDGHLGHVPAALFEHRTRSEFTRRTEARIDRTIVAVHLAVSGTASDEVLGFVTVLGDEVEQLFVDEPCRGTGVAERLLGEAERRIAVDHETAWLAVVAGNRRARRFYERCGWVDAGSFDNHAEISECATMAVPAQRYTKRLDRRAR